jgi:hypothetical protein
LSRCLLWKSSPAEVGCPYGTSVITKDMNLPVMGATDARQKASRSFKLLGSSSLQSLPDN